MVVKFITNILKLHFFQKVNVYLLFEKFGKNKKIFLFKACSSVDRASDSDSESQGFNSLHAYNFFNNIKGAVLVSTFKIR